MTRLSLLTLGIASFASVPALATTYSVGPSSDGCTHTSLSAALSAATTDASPGPHLIKLLTGQRTISNYEISNPLQNITIEGGYDACSGAAPGSGRTTLNNTTASGARVLSLSNSISAARRTINLRRLTISGGRNPAGLGGGGIFATGKLNLYLQAETTIEDNIASNGGGISLVTLSADPDNFTRLRLENGSSITENQATGLGANGYGGGIDCIGGCAVYLWDGNVNFNSARRGGGAVSLRSNASFLEIDPFIGNELVLIANNTAGGETFNTNEGFGGGIYSDQGAITGTMFGTGNDYVVWLFNNTANYGGAIYAVGTETGARTQVSIMNAFVFNNVARSRGGALYSVDGVEWLFDHESVGDCPLFGSRQACSYFSSNQAETAEGGAGGGVAYLTDDGGQAGSAQFFRTLFGGNVDHDGLAAIAEAVNGGILRFQRSVFVDNSAGGPGTQRTLFGTTGSAFEFYYNTVLDNDVDGVFYVGGGSLLPQGSVFWNPGTAFWFSTPGTTMSLVTTCMVSHTLTGLSLPPGAIWVNDPAMNARFAPGGGSSALDHCSSSVAPGPDLYGRSSSLDIASVPNRIGPYDLGAVEQTDIIHYSGFGNRPTN